MRLKISKGTYTFLIFDINSTFCYIASILSNHVLHKSLF